MRKKEHQEEKKKKTQAGEKEFKRTLLKPSTTLGRISGPSKDREGRVGIKWKGIKGGIFERACERGGSFGLSVRPTKKSF